MNVIWFSGRQINDLCATTQKSLAAGLIKTGHNVKFVNPDVEGTHAEYPWDHHGLPTNSIPGFKSMAVSRKMVKWIKKHQGMVKDTVVILDWRVGGKLAPILDKMAVPWILMDRSPPADGNILSRFQWYFWKRSWRLVKQHSNGVGCVVSLAHKEFVAQEIGLLDDKMVVIPAGVDTEVFHNGEKTPQLQLVYHGKIDDNRNIRQVLEIHNRLNELGLEANLNLHGNGNAVKELTRSHSDRFTITQPLDTITLSAKLSSYDIGFLPMPNRKVWRLASPLKRAEYLASGSIVVGIDHTGHRIDDSGEWLYLCEEEDFIEQAVKFIASLDVAKLRELQGQARLFAESNLDWSTTVERLSGLILRQSGR
jgi:glycosyltransferase involved in cell wall biosynthesis